MKNTDTDFSGSNAGADGNAENTSNKMKKALPIILVSVFILLVLGAVLFQVFNPPVKTPQRAYTTQKAVLLLHDYSEEVQTSEADTGTDQKTVLYGVMAERPMYEQGDKTQAAQFFYCDILGEAYMMGSNGTSYKKAEINILAGKVLAAFEDFDEPSEKCATMDYGVPKQDEYHIYLVTSEGVYICKKPSQETLNTVTEFFEEITIIMENSEIN